MLDRNMKILIRIGVWASKTFNMDPNDRVLFVPYDTLDECEVNAPMQPLTDFNSPTVVYQEPDYVILQWIGNDTARVCRVGYSTKYKTLVIALEPEWTL